MKLHILLVVVLVVLWDVSYVVIDSCAVKASNNFCNSPPQYQSTHLCPLNFEGSYTSKTLPQGKYLKLHKYL